MEEPPAGSNNVFPNTLNQHPCPGKAIQPWRLNGPWSLAHFDP
jgi:hypothetical protein